MEKEKKIRYTCAIGNEDTQTESQEKEKIGLAHHVHLCLFQSQLPKDTDRVIREQQGPFLID